MKYIKAFFMSLRMFCAIPLPYRKWDDEARPLMTIMLPFVGLVIGLIWAVLSWGLHALNVPSVLTAGILCTYPYWITGFIHLDGFMDVTDAVRSCRDLDERRRILKDSHSGAFALIGLCILMILAFSSFVSIKPDADYHPLIFIPIVSRLCSAFFVTVLPPMDTSQFSGKYRDGVKKGHVVFILILATITIASAIVLCEMSALVCLGVVVGYFFSLERAYNSLQGMNGDIAGYSLSLSELCGVIVFALL